MSLKRKSLGPVPEDTRRVAKASFPKGNRYLAMSDAFGEIFEFKQFESMYSSLGKLAEDPVRLSLVCIVQFLEGLSDREIAESVRARIDLKYLLRVPLDYAGFNHTVLSDFRDRLLACDGAQVLFDKLLDLARQNNLLKAEKQRTDSTHVLAAAKNLSRLELVVETVRCALESIAISYPEWLRSWVPKEWYALYGQPADEFRLPRKEKDRAALARNVGKHGLELLAKIDRELAEANELDSVKTLRTVWSAQFEQAEDDDLPRMRPKEQLPPASESVVNPHEPDAHFSQKRNTFWLGYKVHFTETCDPEAPRLVTDVFTTSSVLPDNVVIADIQTALENRGVKPTKHIVDGGYVNADMIQSSEKKGISLVGPFPPNSSWQALQGKGFEAAKFVIDWSTNTALCPEGKTSKRFRERPKRESLEVRFPAAVCNACPAKANCTTSKAGRQLEIRSQEFYVLAEEHRARQQTDEFKSDYALRSGIEGTHSQAARNGNRRSRFANTEGTKLHNLLTAVALNFGRIANWVLGVPCAKRRKTRFALLQCAA